MSCARDKTLPTRTDHGKSIPSADEWPKLIQLQPRALKEMSKSHEENPDIAFRIFIQGFG